MTELESYRQWMHPAHELAPKMRTLADCVEPGTPTKGSEFVVTTAEPKPVSSELLESVQVPTKPDPLYHFTDGAINSYPFAGSPILGRVAYWNPMTLERAVEVLSAHCYRECFWIIDMAGAGDATQWALGEFIQPSTGQLCLTEFEAIAIAEKLLRESE